MNNKVDWKDLRIYCMRRFQSKSILREIELQARNQYDHSLEGGIVLTAVTKQSLLTEISQSKEA